MSFGKKKVVAPQYEKFKDTPWITQGREIADIGGKGILKNYSKVNVFSPETQASLDARNNAIYQRAFDDASRMYKDTMNKYNAANYNQFGTLNATAPAYRTDEYQRQFQRQLNDLAYNKAVNYENLINNELQRRYNTLDMYGNMYGYGQTPHQVDIANWNTANTNKDLVLKAMQANNSGSGFGNILTALGAGIGAAYGSNNSSSTGSSNPFANLFSGGFGGSTNQIA